MRRRAQYTISWRQHSLAMSTIAAERTTRRPGIYGGKACVAGHRIRVMDIVGMYDQMQMSPVEIVEQLPTLTLSDVHSALAYYYDHMDEIQEDIRRNAEVAEQLRARFPSTLSRK